MHGANRDRVLARVCPRHERNHGNTKRCVPCLPNRYDTKLLGTKQTKNPSRTQYRRTDTRTNHGRRNARLLHQFKKESHHMLSSMHRDDFRLTRILGLDVFLLLVLYLEWGVVFSLRVLDTQREQRGSEPFQNSRNTEAPHTVTFAGTYAPICVSFVFAGRSTMSVSKQTNTLPGSSRK